jgi:Choline dehydrogenase and related flavoproteins
MDYDVIIIGTGFGSTVAATLLAATGKKILLLERGTFWFTPEKLGKPAAGAKSFLDWAAANRMPVQFWPRPDHRKGLLDLVAALRSSLKQDGVYQYSRFHQADVLTANGVGGGSLIYSNVTLRPRRKLSRASA